MLWREMRACNGCVEEILVVGRGNEQIGSHDWNPSLPNSAVEDRRRCLEAILIYIILDQISCGRDNLNSLCIEGLSQKKD